MTVIKAWSRLSSKRLADSRIMSFCEARDQSPYTDKAHDFIYLDSFDWVNIVPITAQQEVVMIKQYRHGDQSISLEIPGGMVDANEQAMQAACRGRGRDRCPAFTSSSILGAISSAGTAFTSHSGVPVLQTQPRQW